MSPTLACGKNPVITVVDPWTITSGGPTHTHISLRRAAGIKVINTCGQQGGMIGPPTWGTKTVTCGHVCMSVTLAAGGICLSTDLIQLRPFQALALELEFQDVLPFLISRKECI
jgi:hypothetical protein